MMKVIRNSRKIILFLTVLTIIVILHYFTMDFVEIYIYHVENRNFSIIDGKCITKINNSESPIIISEYLPTWQDLNDQNWSTEVRDGFWSPVECKSEQSLAIIVPYRQREQHLRKLLSHLHPFLQNQKVEYQIILIEQSFKGIFNKGALINVGIREAMSIASQRFTCFIIHDVDMLPLMNNNIYQCLDNPLHLGTAVDKFNYSLVYRDIVGGVLALNEDQLKKLNGFSNVYEGWGAEDDDMSERIKYEKMKIIRYPLSIGKYMMIKHTEDMGNTKNVERVYFLRRAGRRYKIDGLNSISYKKLAVTQNKTNLVHWSRVEIPSKSFFIKPEF